MPVVSCDQKRGMLPRIWTNEEKLRKLLFPTLTYKWISQCEAASGNIRRGLWRMAHLMEDLLRLNIVGDFAAFGDSALEKPCSSKIA